MEIEIKLFVNDMMQDWTILQDEIGYWIAYLPDHDDPETGAPYFKEASWETLFALIKAYEMGKAA